MLNRSVELRGTAYICWVPCGIGGVFLCLDGHIGNQHPQEHQRTDHQPACLPEDVGPRPSHEINVFTEAVSGQGEQRKS